MNRYFKKIVLLDFQLLFNKNVEDIKIGKMLSFFENVFKKEDK